MNLVLQISPKCGQGGEGVKKCKIFADVIYGWPLSSVDRIVMSDSMRHSAVKLDMGVGFYTFVRLITMVKLDMRLHFYTLVRLNTMVQLYMGLGFYIFVKLNYICLYRVFENFPTEIP